MKRVDAHENEAGLRPMKRAFGLRRSYRALRFMRAKFLINSRVLHGATRRFMFAKQTLHRHNVEFMIYFIQICQYEPKNPAHLASGAKGQKEADIFSYRLFYIALPLWAVDKC